MKKIKVLLIGNSSCVNRGDSAILDGLISGIKELNQEEMEITATSVQHFESEILLKQPLIPDFSYKFKSKLFSNFSIFNKLWYKYLLFYEILILALSAKFESNYIPRKFKDISNHINKFDIIIQVGGSYFVDLYTPLKYVSLAISIILKKPVYLAGHSIGPFESRKSKLIPKLLFSKVNKIYLREGESLKYINNLIKNYDNVVISTDSAWLIPENKFNPIFREEVKTKKPLIAITIRDLKPFDKRLGISQEYFENLFVNILDKLIDQGFHIVGVSMGTGFGNYAHDDRIAAHRVKSKLKKTKEMSVLMYEYNHLEVGYILSKCKMLIGTRLHSVILSLRYNTPALAIFYEHKSLGILNKMNFGENSFYIENIGSDLFYDKIDDILNNQEKHKLLVKEKVDIERKLGIKMIKEILNEK